MEETPLSAGVTKEFLEQVLSAKVRDFKVEREIEVGGEGFTCPLLCVDVWMLETAKELEEGAPEMSGDVEEPLRLFIKCYPSVPGRQTYMDMSNYFWKELRVYDTLIPELHAYQAGLGVETVNLPMAPFFYGSYVEPDERKTAGTPLKPLDNCIVLKDLRMHGEFRLRDKFKGLDLDHYRLVVEAQARLHAVSWVYKYKHGLENLWDKFPFLKMDLHEDMVTMMEIFDKEAHQMCSNIVQDDYEAVKGLKHLLAVAPSIMALYYSSNCNPGSVSHTKDSVLKKPLPPLENEEAWTAVCHGDCASSNMLFRYDHVTGKPVEVMMVDLQLTREGDPLSDVAYALYCGTTRSFRQKHLRSMLHLYYDNFTDICAHFDVPCFPGWSWEEFNRRFHRARIYGGWALKSLPTYLKSEIDCVDVEPGPSKKRGSGSSRNMRDDEEDEFILSLNKFEVIHPALRERLTGGLLELVEDDVI